MNTETFSYNGETYPYTAVVLAQVAGLSAKEILLHKEREHLTRTVSKWVVEAATRKLKVDHGLEVSGAKCIRVDGEIATWKVAIACDECDDGYISGKKSDFECPACDGTGEIEVRYVQTDMDGDGMREVSEP